MATEKLKADKRKITGRKVKKLRQEGKIPANIYGKGVKSTSIEVEEKDFKKVFDEAGETGIIEISLGKETRPVLVHNIQVDPITGGALHVDFRQVNLKEKVTAQVPVETTGESPAEKQGLGTAVQYLDEVEVEALPMDLPEVFEVDLTGLTEVDQAIFVKDLPVDKKKVEIKQDPEEIVVKIEPLREEEEEPVAPPSPEDVEITEEKGEEGEGEEAPKEASEEKKEEEAKAPEKEE